MFDYKHYVPVLRWKRAEWVALRELNPGICHFITPLIEIPPVKFNDPKARDIRTTIKEIYTNINLSWKDRPFFLDIAHLMPSKQIIAENILKIVCGNIALTIPVISPRLPESTIELIASINKQNASGICLRLKLCDIFPSTNIKEIVESIKIPPQHIDLIVDLEMTGEQTPSFSNICASFPYLLQWRTFTILGGVFPRDLTNFTPGQHELTRGDWSSWQEGILKDSLKRNPSFGDYAIQHPYYYEPPAASNPSASIRYTASKYWIIMRGQSAKRKGYKQWFAHAVLLSERSEFCGRDFSSGDKYIYERGQLRDKTGNFETWLRAGINHHLTFVAHQISNFSVS